MVKRQRRLWKNFAIWLRRIGKDLRDWTRNAEMARSYGGWYPLFLILIALAISGWISPYKLKNVFELAVTPLAVLWGIKNFPSASQSQKEASFWETTTRLMGIWAVIGIFVFLLIPHGGLWGVIRMFGSPLVILLMSSAICAAWAGFSRKPIIARRPESQQRELTLANKPTNHNTVLIKLKELRDKQRQREEKQLSNRYVKATVRQVYLLLLIVVLLALLTLGIVYAPSIAIAIQGWNDARYSLAILRMIDHVEWLPSALMAEILTVGPFQLLWWQAIPFVVMHLYLTVNFKSGRYGITNRQIQIEPVSARGSRPGWLRCILRTILSPLLVMLPVMSVGTTVFDKDQMTLDRNIAAGLFFTLIGLFLMTSQSHRGRTPSDILAGTRLVLIMGEGHDTEQRD